MELLLLRQVYSQVCTKGQLYVDSAVECHTLEPKEQGDAPLCIPEGKYEVRLEMSPHFGYPTPHLQDVPGRSYIEIHIGNYPSQTHGCILVGQTTDTDFIGMSKAAFDALLTKFQSASGPIYITVRRAEQSNPV